MSITLETVESIAPDQASLAAAAKLRKPGKWPVRLRDAGSRLVWGECQGSGANPYRVVFDAADHGYKCTCPSRKFPCKHVLALMWMYADDASGFAEQASAADWVNEWMGRRRKSDGTGAEPTSSGPAKGGKNLDEADTEEEASESADPKVIESRRKAAETRAATTRRMILDSLDELEGWIADQLRLGLGGFLDDDRARCRRIAARLIDGRATTLAGRLDEWPARLARLGREERLDATLREFSRLLLLARAFRADPEDPALRAAIAAAPTRDDWLALEGAEVAEGIWEALGTEVHTQRDGLVRQATWLMRVEPAPVRFALLLDYHPASAGKRSAGFAPGEQFPAALVFLPGPRPLRAIIQERGPSVETQQPWPGAAAGHFLAPCLEWFAANPWGGVHPVLLPAGRLGTARRGRDWWWQSHDASGALPLAEEPPRALAACEMTRGIALWDGDRARLLAADTRHFGPCHLS